MTQSKEINTSNNFFLLEEEIKSLSFSGNLTLDKVKLFHKLGGNLNIVNSAKWSLIHSASYNGQTDIVDYLLNNNIDIEAETYIQETALIHASLNGYYNIVVLLLDNKANINHQNKYGYSALHYAVKMNNMDMVQLLVQYKANLLLKTNFINQLTALELAIKEEHYEIRDFLIPYYINIGIKIANN